MNNNILLISIILILLGTLNSFAQEKTDAHIIGHVQGDGEHLPFATIIIEGTTIGTATDETGHFRILNLEKGEYKVKAQAIGFKPEVKMVNVVPGNTSEIKFNLTKDLIGLEQVVVSANRNEQSRKDAVTIVNTITPKIFESTQSTVFGEALNFTPGLRLENNCQNCGFNQVRMNGLEGPYSQILINSRPIFSGLAGVYGLELFPVNMIERVEVVRGGGSALFGSNAIAGTINLITKDPIKNGFEINTTGALTGIGYEDNAFDQNVNFNASVVDLEAKAGVTIFGNYRDRKPFDANDDGYSELSEILNTTLGFRAYHRIGNRGKITGDFFNIREKRRGGDRFDYPLHESNIAEAVEHNINTAALSYDKLFNAADKWTVFGSVQHLKRDSYYGAEQDLSAYGKSEDLSYSVGTQINIEREKLLFAKGSIIAGIENNGGFLNDNKLGFLDSLGVHQPNTLIADQQLNVLGAFLQGEWTWENLKATVGLRLDRYSILDHQNTANKKTGNVLSPRLSLKYDVSDYLSLRASYSEGFRAPQIFDEDLHIEVSGSRKIIHENSPDLKQEESKSYMFSVNFDQPVGTMQSQFLIEGFFTQLLNPFANEYGAPNEEGVVTYTRVNAKSGAFVGGANFEWSAAPSEDFYMSVGFTYQVSKFEEPQELGEKQFLRTPNDYGFLNLDYDFAPNWCLSVSGNYTGEMLIPYFGEQQENPEEGKIITSERFLDAGTKLSRDIRLNGTTLQLSVGVKNIFDAYQSDFDSGIDRDPGYIYGPGLPRTITFGVKFSNFL